MTRRIVQLTPAAREAILDFAHGHAAALLRCPAITVEAARESAEAWAHALAQGMKDGTFAELDGEPCLMRLPERPPVAKQIRKQMTLGDPA